MQNPINVYYGTKQSSRVVSDPGSYSGVLVSKFHTLVPNFYTEMIDHDLGLL
jgi:hypothetical protein